METIQLSGRIQQSIVDGPGLRYTIFTQGCPHACPGCHNPETWSFEGGTAVTASTLCKEIESNPLLQGVTFSGGEPLSRPAELLPLAKAVKAMGKNIVCYTGYTFEELLELQKEDAALARLLPYIDILIDGRYEQDKRDLTLVFRGSSNQRILNMPASLAKQTAVLEEKYYPEA